MALYLESNGFRGIARSLSKIFKSEISFQIVSHWINSAGTIAQNEVFKRQKEASKARKDLAIVEMDDLYTYIKKPRKNFQTGIWASDYTKVWTVADPKSADFEFEVGSGDKKQHEAKSKNLLGLILELQTSSLPRQTSQKNSLVTPKILKL